MALPSASRPISRRTARRLAADAGLLTVAAAFALPLAWVVLSSLDPRADLRVKAPEGLTLDALVERVRSGSVRELIMATNPNLEGDGTALLVANRLADLDVPITRLARGLASGSVLEFANKEMLADAFLGRQRF